MSRDPEVFDRGEPPTGPPAELNPEQAAWRICALLAEIPRFSGLAPLQPVPFLPEPFVGDFRVGLYGYCVLWADPPAGSVLARFMKRNGLMVIDRTEVGNVAGVIAFAEAVLAEIVRLRFPDDDALAAFLKIKAEEGGKP